MKCFEKEIIVSGLIADGQTVKLSKITVLITNNEKGKTLSVCAGPTPDYYPHIHLNAKDISKYLEGDYKK